MAQAFSGRRAEPHQNRISEHGPGGLVVPWDIPHQLGAYTSDVAMDNVVVVHWAKSDFG